MAWLLITIKESNKMKNYLSDKITKLPATALSVTLQELQDLQKGARVTLARAQRAEAACDYSTSSLEDLEAIEKKASQAFTAYNKAYHSKA
jgi:hypothetical protein